MSETPTSPVEEPPVERLPPRGASPLSELAPAKKRAALVIAVAADVIQWVLGPLVLWGAASPVDDVFDLAVAVVLVRLIGFHWALLPAFITKIVPFVDLVPTWTAAVWLATRGRGRGVPDSTRPGAAAD